MWLASQAGSQTLPYFHKIPPASHFPHGFSGSMGQMGMDYSDEENKEPERLLSQKCYLLKVTQLVTGRAESGSQCWERESPSGRMCACGLCQDCSFPQATFKVVLAADALEK